MFLAPVNSAEPPEYWWGSDEVCAMRRVNGKYYTTSTTPVGDKLTVKRYQGDFGTLKLAAGKRDLKRLSMTGSLRSETSAVAVGEPANRGRANAEPTAECSIPVGDYLPAYLSIEYGQLQIDLSDNYHSDGRPRDITTRSPVHAFKIRKDKPFVLDFSNKPEVLFASPARDQTLKPGDTLRVAAVLTDPCLDIMIRHLNDTGRKQKETYKFADGKEQSVRAPCRSIPRSRSPIPRARRWPRGSCPLDETAPAGTRGECQPTSSPPAIARRSRSPWPATRWSCTANCKPRGPSRSPRTRPSEARPTRILLFPNERTCRPAAGSVTACQPSREDGLAEEANGEGIMGLPHHRHLRRSRDGCACRESDGYRIRCEQRRGDSLHEMSLRRCGAVASLRERHDDRSQ